MRVTVKTRSISIRYFFGVIFSFLLVFRPSVAFEGLYGFIFLAPFVMIFFLTKVKFVEEIINIFGGVFWFILLSLFFYSFTADFLSGAFSIVGSSTITFVTARIIFYIFACYFILWLIHFDYNILLLIYKYLIFIQLFIASAMLVSPEFKKFIFVDISGLPSDHNYLLDYFFAVRGFGWSAELYYLGPAALILMSLFLCREKLSVINICLFLGSCLFGLLNARIAVAVMPLMVVYLFGLKAGLIISIGLVVPLIGVLFFYFSGGLVYQYVVADFTSNYEYALFGSRTLGILFSSHVHYLLDFRQAIFGGFFYLWGGTTGLRSDIGWIIILNYGGWIFLVFSLYLIFRVCVLVSSNHLSSVLMFLIMIILGIKGNVFAGNAMMAILFLHAIINVRNRRSGEG